MQLISHIKDRWFSRQVRGEFSDSRSASSVTQALGNSRFMLHATGKLRRFCQVHFRKGYVHRQMQSRKGNCQQCGTCCNLLFTCPMLTTGGRCFAYGTCRPQACKVFPINQRDIREVSFCGAQCGFHFHDEPGQHVPGASR